MLMQPERTSQPQQVEDDKRYRILVNLVRSDRPRYWSFYCPHCAGRVCELTNNEIVSMTDFIDFNNTNLATVGTRCNGRIHGMGRCDFWYYFNLSDERPAKNGTSAGTVTGRLN